MLFAVVGLASHGRALSAGRLAADVVPLLVSWLGIGVLVGLYRSPRWWRLVVTWAAAVPLAVLVRALLLGRPLDGKEAGFLGVALAATAVFDLAARGALALVRR